MSSRPAELMADQSRRAAQPDSKQQTTYARPGSVKPSEQYASVHPTLQQPTNAASLVERKRHTARDELKYTARSAYLTAHYASRPVHDDDGYEQDEDTAQHLRSIGTAHRRPYDESLPPVLPLRLDSLPVVAPEHRIQEFNVAVIGADSVGKTTFLQRALDLPNPPYNCSVEQKVAYQSSHYLIRLLEIPIDDLDVDDDDDTICWPDTIGNRMTPKIDGALTLYDVKDRSSLDQVPDVLTALSKASVPSIMISYKCDVSPSDNLKRGLSMIIRAITTRAGGDIAAAKRRRAQSNALHQIPPVHPIYKGHTRAASEHSSIILRDKLRRESLAAHGSADHLRAPQGIAEDGMQRSFLLEGSGTDSSAENSETSNVEEPATTAGMEQSITESGTTFDELVDRLLAQPMSKSDSKFSAIFLALYRKFAAPGKLFETIVQRFEATDRVAAPELTKVAAQLRLFGILAQWIAGYPGDFAFPKTKRRLQTFIKKIGNIAILSAAANEMSHQLLTVRENDDTKWAYSDEDREVHDIAMGYSALPVHDLLDDLEDSFLDNLSGLTVTEDVGLAAGLVFDKDRPASDTSTTSSQIMQNPSVARREAQQLEPTERIPLSKDHWRALLEIPDDIIANELTRMDWVMFSSIRPRDLVRHVSLNSLEKNAYKNLANVDRMISHFNQVAAWVANFVLIRDKPKHRALMQEKFMRVARKLRELNNYNSLGAIIAGMKSSAIHRLAATRELLPPAVGKEWMQLEVLMSPSRSHSAYRLAWENSSTERIPYIPLHRRDLVSAEEGNRTFIGDESNGRVNWKKFEVMGEVVISLQRAQGLPYRGFANWNGGAQVRELVLDLQLVKDEEELYVRSTQCEPPAGSTTGTTARFMEFFKRQ